MQITDIGRKTVKENQFKSELLSLAITHLHLHGAPVPEVENRLRFTVAMYLAAVPWKRGYRLPQGYEMNGDQEFIKEHAALIEPLVQEAVEGATGQQKAMK
jgi:hypothetical protein